MLIRKFCVLRRVNRSINEKCVTDMLMMWYNFEAY